MKDGPTYSKITTYGSPFFFVLPLIQKVEIDFHVVVKVVVATPGYYWGNLRP